MKIWGIKRELSEGSLPERPFFLKVSLSRRKTECRLLKAGKKLCLTENNKVTRKAIAMNTYEIEIKLPIVDKDRVQTKLLQLGFEVAAKIRECDMYYNSVYHDVKELGEALRIRKSTDLLTGITKAQINFKGKKIDKVSMSRQEYETVVEDADSMEQILKSLDFLPVAGVMKTRIYLQREKMTACLDQVDGLGDFLELEVIAHEEASREIHLKNMEQLLTTLGLSMKDTVRTSYLGMLLRQEN